MIDLLDVLNALPQKEAELELNELTAEDYAYYLAHGSLDRDIELN